MGHFVENLEGKNGKTLDSRGLAFEFSEGNLTQSEIELGNIHVIVCEKSVSSEVETLNLRVLEEFHVSQLMMDML